MNSNGSFSIDTQKEIIQHYISKDRAILEKEFAESDNEKQPILNQAIKFCKKNQATLIVAKLDRLSLDRDLVFSIKKKLENRLRCCDMPTTDRLTLSIFLDIIQCQKTIQSITLKAAFKNKKLNGASFGYVKNLTAAGRKLGFEKIKKNAKESKTNQRVMTIIKKCKNANMSFGQIASELNQLGFKTTR